MADGLNIIGTAQTGTQRVSSTLGVGPQPLAREGLISYRDARKMRKHPTIALARALTIAPIVAGEWLVQPQSPEVPPEWVDFVSAFVLPHREQLLQRAFEDGCDYGWSPFEKIFDARPWRGSDRLVVRKFKPLYHDITDIRVDGDTFAGFRQVDRASGKDVLLDVEYALLISFRVEGDYLYGEPQLENCKMPYCEWLETNAGAARYDRKIAGSHWLVEYPVGSTVQSAGGAEVDNATIAEQLLKALESSGSVCIPISITSSVEALNSSGGTGWKVSLLSDASPRQGSFVERLAYLDKCLVRGFCVPERAILEGQYGTKAEAATHGDAAVTQMELQQRYVTRIINWHVVDQLLSLNFGEDARGAVQLVCAPLSAANRAWLQAVFTALLANPAAFNDIAETADFAEIARAAGVPMRDVTDAAGGEATPTIRTLGGMDDAAPLAAAVARMYERATLGTNGVH